MDQVSVLDVIDRDSEQNAQIIVRSSNGFVALTLTLEHDGDLQVVISPSECQELVSRLQQAIFDAQGGMLVTSKPSSSARHNDDNMISRQEIVEVELDRGGKVKNG